MLVDRVLPEQLESKVSKACKASKAAPELQALALQAQQDRKAILVPLVLKAQLVPEM
jgi:hypothetical protein